MHPTNCATGSGFRNRIGAISFHPLFLTALSLGWFWLGVTEGMFWIYCTWFEGGLTAFPWVPPSLFNCIAGVAHSQAIWSQPWHLKQCQAPCVPPCTLVCMFWFPLRGDSALVLLTMEELQVEVWPRPVQPLWELGQTEVFLSICPLPWPLCLGLLGALAEWLLYSALVKAAINLSIWSPRSFEPEDTSVAAADLALTLVSSVLLSALLAVTTSSE